MQTDELVGVYGFGSFFRSEVSNDCDLVLVIKNDSNNMGQVHENLNRLFFVLGEKLSIKFDLTVLTEREFLRKPLLEHDMLISILSIAHN